MLERIVISFSSGSSRPRNQTQVSLRQMLYRLSHQESLALEQVSVITGLKRTQESTNKQKANNKVIKQGPGSSRDILNNTSLSSAGTKAPTQVKDAMMMLTLLT